MIRAPQNPKCRTVTKYKTDFLMQKSVCRKRPFRYCAISTDIWALRLTGPHFYVRHPGLQTYAVIKIGVFGAMSLHRLYTISYIVKFG